MEQAAEFRSGQGLRIRGGLLRPPAPAAADAVPGVIVCHGFAGASYPPLVANLRERGFAVLDFKFRGYGASEGERGRVVPLEQVEDLVNAVSWLREQPGIDEARIAVVGSSLGGSVAILATARDARIKACVAGCPVASGEALLRQRHRDPESWERFMARVARAPQDRPTIDRFEIVYIPEPLRRFLPADSPMLFTPATVAGFREFAVEAAVAEVAPRPLLLLHAVDDEVVPLSETQLLASKAGPGRDVRILPEGNHFMFGRPEVIAIIGDWLEQHVPLAVSAQA